jgi:two-component system sensor histidine kinase/response regulator
MIEETANGAAAALRLRIAELERAVATATAATAAKAAYAATLSHEIRTPLGALLGMAELAAETNDPTAVREYLAVILGAGEDLLAVVNDALDLAKLEADQLRSRATSSGCWCARCDRWRGPTSRWP